MDHVLVIDETASRRDVVDGLREMGCQVDEETDRRHALQRAQEECHHIIIINEVTPPESSTDLLVALREITQRPIVVMGEGGETALVEALLRGADLYVEWPMQARELAARVHALVRRCQEGAGLDGYLGNLDDGLQLSQVFEKLSQTETKLLRFLLERDGQLTAREELMAGIWGDRGKETSLRFYIWQLRRKLNGVGRIEIMNMKGMGYLLKVHPAS